MKFFEPLIETVQTVDVRSDMTLDCSANVDTNGRVSYKWLGELVPPYSVQSTKPQLFVSHPSLRSYQLLKCVVTLVDDPHNVKWKFQYILNFLQPAASLQENGSSSRRDVTISVTAALLVCGVVLLMGWMVILILFRWVSCFCFFDVLMMMVLVVSDGYGV